MWAMLALLALLGAHAADSPAARSTDDTGAASWEVGPYWDRGLRFGGVSIGGASSLQAIAGVEGGLQYRWSAPPRWTGRTRVALTGIYSLSSGSTGGGVALGSFIGPDGKRVRVQTGPDLWFDGYGTRSSLDYHLPWSPGVSWMNHALVKVVDQSGLLFGAHPGWVVVPERQSRNLPTWVHELTLFAGVHARLDVFSVTVGYQRAWTGAGVIDGIVLSGGI